MIPNRWYPILDGSRLKIEKPVALMRLGQHLVLWRARSGEAVAMPDRCPHRSAILSTGKIRDGCLECPYHGLRFDRTGKCVMIPANGANAPVPKGFDITTLPLREQHGIIWQWYGAGAPAGEVPWIDTMPEAGRDTVTYTWDLAVSHLRLTENLLDFHHFNFLHRWTLPGAGPRVEDYEAQVRDDTVFMSGILRHERPGRLRPDNPFKAAFKLPALAHIEIFGGSINYALTPIDDSHTWVFARYAQPNAPRFGRRLGLLLGAGWDRLIAVYQDAPVLNTQVDPLGDFSRFHLYEADRAIALFFGLRKRALLEASASEHEVTAAAGR